MQPPMVLGERNGILMGYRRTTTEDIWRKLNYKFYRFASEGEEKLLPCGSSIVVLVTGAYLPLVPLIAKKPSGFPEVIR